MTSEDKNMADLNNENDIWFADEELHFEQLLHILNQNQFKAEVRGEHIYVSEGFKYPVSLTLNELSGTIQCRAKIQLQENYFEPDFANFLAHLNTGVGCAFHLEHEEKSDRGYLVGSNFFIKSEGLSYKMLLSNVIWFVSFFLAGCRVDEEIEFLEYDSAIFDEKTYLSS
jgi:hypothetical protein